MYGIFGGLLQVFGFRFSVRRCRPNTTSGRCAALLCSDELQNRTYPKQKKWNRRKTRNVKKKIEKNWAPTVEAFRVIFCTSFKLTAAERPPWKWNVLHHVEVERLSHRFTFIFIFLRETWPGLQGHSICCSVPDTYFVEYDKSPRISSKCFSQN